MRSKNQEVALINVNGRVSNRGGGMIKCGTHIKREMRTTIRKAGYCHAMVQDHPYKSSTSALTSCFISSSFWTPPKFGAMSVDEVSGNSKATNVSIGLVVLQVMVGRRCADDIWQNWSDVNEGNEMRSVCWGGCERFLLPAVAITNLL